MSISRKQLKDELLTTPDGLLAGGFGSGLSPIAPGTAGSLAAMIPGYFLLQWHPTGFVVVIATTFLIGTWVCDRVGKRLGRADHGALVIDEFVGMWITLLAATTHPASLAAAFLLFRAFDVIKPPPIRQLERGVKGGLGVMLDDVLAGLLAAGTLLLLTYGYGEITS